MEAKLFDGEPPFQSAEWYTDREHAPHIDQEWHQPRLAKAKEFVRYGVLERGVRTVADLGAGDGGFIQSLQDLPATCWGIDLQPSNVHVAQGERGVDVRYGDFVDGLADIDPVDLIVMTETLEHLGDPHRLVREIAEMDKAKFIVASSPVNETADFHYEHHLFAWDMQGYSNLFTRNGWTITKHEIVSVVFQVLFAERE